VARAGHWRCRGRCLCAGVAMRMHLQDMGLRVAALACACGLVSGGCQRADSKVTESRARAAAAERAERASRFAMDDKTFQGVQPGGPGAEAPPAGPAASISDLIDDVNGEVSAILAEPAD